MGKDTKILFFQIVDGTQEEIRVLGEALNKVKQKLPYDIEFLICNDRIQLYDVKYLLKELIDLYKREERKLKAIKNGKQ